MRLDSRSAISGCVCARPGSRALRVGRPSADACADHRHGGAGLRRRAGAAQRLLPVVRQSDVDVLAQDTLDQLKACVVTECHAVFTRAIATCPSQYSLASLPRTGCAVCEKLARFLTSEATSATFRAYKLNHIGECLVRSRLADCITIARPLDTIDGHAVLTKTPTHALYTRGDRMLNSLLMGLPQ